MKSILVVEDFIVVQRFIREMLESKGYSTLGASNVNAALEILINQGDRIDLVLTDYHMPDGTGYDLLKKIVDHNGLRQKPVMFLTTESNPLLLEQANGLKPVTWITKPYKSDVLFEEIKKLID